MYSMDQLREKLRADPIFNQFANIAESQLRDLYKIMTGKDWNDKRYIYVYEDGDVEWFGEDYELMEIFGAGRHELRCFELGKEVVSD